MAGFDIGLNTLDFLLILFLFIGMLIGLVRGVMPQVVSLMSIWLGLVVTLWLYKPFSFRILQGVGFAKSTADTLSFLILITVFFNAVRLVVRYLTVPPEERKKKKKDPDDPLAEAAKTATEKYVLGPLKALGGMVLGLVLMTLWLSLILGLLQFIFQDALFEGGAVPRTGLRNELRYSLLVDYYFNPVLWGLAQSVDFFIPKNADIFRSLLKFLI